MSQFDPTYEQAPPTTRRTSGVAIAALVFALLGIIPCLGMVTVPIGLILGLIAVAVLGGDAPKGGRGLAIASIVLCLVFAVEQYWIGTKVYNFMLGFYEVVMKGPENALQAGYAGDMAGFKGSFFGAGATATDQEVQTFLVTLEDRYGAYVGSTFDESGGSVQPQPGQTQVPFPYILQFMDKTLAAEAEIVFADPSGATPGIINKLCCITVFDPDLGDVTFPVPSDAASPAGGGAPDAGDASGADEPPPGDG